jgi:hypothetical protein
VTAAVRGYALAPIEITAARTFVPADDFPAMGASLAAHAGVNFDQHFTIFAAVMPLVALRVSTTSFASFTISA